MINRAVSATGGHRVLAAPTQAAASSPQRVWRQPCASPQQLRQPTRCKTGSAPNASNISAAGAQQEAEAEGRSTTATINSGSTISASPLDPLDPSTPHFSDLPLDRSGGLRKEEERLEALLAAPTSRVLLLHQHRLLAAAAHAPEASAPGLNNSSGTGTSSHDISVMSSHSGLVLHPHSFAPPGTLAPDGGEPRWVPLVVSAPDLRAAMPPGLQQQAEFVFLGMDGKGSAVFAAQAPQHLLHLLPPLPPPKRSSKDRASSSSSHSQTVAAADSHQSVATPPGASPAAAAGQGPEDSSKAAPPATEGWWVDVRRQGQAMTGPDAAVAALAAGLVQWHASAAFCSSTGSRTQASNGGHSRTAEAPAGGRTRTVYPRIDPAVIVAVSCGDWLLLGRKASWEVGRYSCLAGFAELGETLEQAVGREVIEESGVAVDLRSVRYHSSQPWPFPQSLMIGFTAEAAIDTAGAAAGAAIGAVPAQHQDSGSTSSAGDQSLSSPAVVAPRQRGLALLSGPAVVAAREVGLLPAEAERYLLPVLPPVKVDPRELEDARWFHADWLAAALAGGGPPAVVRSGSGSSGSPDSSASFRIPGKYALAHSIITSWLRETQQRRRQRATILSAGSVGGAAMAEVDLAAEAALASVPDVCIDEGSFKYVLLRLSTPDGLHSKLLVRGDSRAAYHNHIMQVTAAEVRAAAPEAGLVLDTVGGGRIEHYSQQRTLSIFGFSSAFGQAPHDVTAALLRRWLPLHDLAVSYQGY